MEQKTNEKRLFRLVAFVTIIVFALIIILKSGLIKPDGTTPKWMFQLPLLNAIINGTCAVLLMASFVAIRRKKIQIHKKINLTAFFLSALFLLSYILFHLYVPSTKFGGEGTIRTLYFIVLISHIILAALILPMILISFWYGLRMEVNKHKRIVRFTFPIWLYVAITGVLVYIMVSPYYSF